MKKFVICLISVIALAGCKKEASSSFKEAVKSEKSAVAAVNATVAGCFAVGQQVPELGMAIALTQGQICMQIVGDQVKALAAGSGSTDEKANFTKAYLRTLTAAQILPKTAEEELASEELLNSTFDTFKQEQAAQKE